MSDPALPAPRSASGTVKSRPDALENPDPSRRRPRGSPPRRRSVVLGPRAGLRRGRRIHGRARCGIGRRDRRSPRALTVDEIPIAVSLLTFFLHEGRVQPYALAGIGYTWAKPRGVGTNAGASSPAENLFALHAGAGVDVRTSFRTSVFVDGRYVFLDVDAVKALPNQPKADYLRIAAGFNVFF
jgi:hypothetical protein